jgi:hypothetical protein
VVCCYGQIRALLRSPRNRVLFGQLDVLTLSCAVAASRERWIRVVAGGTRARHS